MERASTQDSAPPASMTSASPSRMMRNASPRLCAPLAHAVAAAWAGALHRHPLQHPRATADAAWKLPGSCLEAVWKLPGRRAEGVDTALL